MASKSLAVLPAGAETFEDARGSWVSVRVASKRLGVTEHALYMWEQDGCPWLDGRRISACRRVVSGPMPAAHGQRTYRRVFLLQRELDTIAALARTTEAGAVEVNGERWLCAAVAAERYPVASSELSVWRRLGCPAIGGRKLAARRFPVGPLGRAGDVKHWFYLEADVKAIVARRAEEIDGFEDSRGRWVSQKVAAARCAVSEQTIAKYCERGRTPTGKKLLTCRRLVWTGRGRSHRRFLLEADVEESARQRRSLAASGTAGEWLTLREAIRAFPLEKGTVWYWSTHNCKHLGGRKLRRQRFMSVTKAGSMKAVWKYYRADLACVAERFSSSDDGIYRDSQGAWVPIRTASRKRGWSTGCLEAWSRDGCPYLGGKKLRAKRVPYLQSNKPDGLAWAIHEEDLDLLAERLADAVESVYSDSAGKWFSASYICRRYPIERKTLEDLRKKQSDILGGRRIRAKRVHLRVGRRRYKKTWVYHEADVREIIAARNGGSVAAVASAAPVEPSRGAVRQTGRDESTNGNGRQADAETETDLEALRATLPPFGSDAWVSNKEAAHRDGLTTRSLSTYRSDGIHSDDLTLGRDKNGRIWRRFGTPESHPWYLRSSLLSDR